MNIHLVDHRTTYKTEKCDAVIEKQNSSDLIDPVIKGFESQEISVVLGFAKDLRESVVVYLYDINSKPLK